jgi:hypothetical protein
LQRDDTNNIDEQHLHGKVRYLASADLTIDTVWNHHHIDNGYDAFSLNNNRTTLSDQPGQDRQQINAFSMKADYRGLAMMDSTTLVTAMLAATMKIGRIKPFIQKPIQPSIATCAIGKMSV